MADLSDEVLMAHADGELDSAERARIDRLLVTDPAVRAQWTKFQSTGKTLANLFQGRLDDPVPQRLIDLVLGQNGVSAGPVGVRGVVGHWLNIRSATSRLISDRSPAWRPALAYSAVLFAGACVGWVLHEVRGAPGMARTIAVQGDGRILAQGALQRALETAPSGVRVDSTPGLEETATVQIRLSFRNRQRAFCREYELTQTSGPSRFRGLACRSSDGHWQVRVSTPVERHEPASGKVSPAGTDDPLAAYVGRMIGDDPLDRAGEAAAISNHWRADLP